MKSIWAVLVILVVAACGTTETQTLLVSDYGYSLDGMEASNLEQFKAKLRAKDPIEVAACSCADAKLLVAATEWLRSQGVKKVSMKAIPGTERKCGMCK